MNENARLLTSFVLLVSEVIRRSSSLLEGRQISRRAWKTNGNALLTTAEVMEASLKELHRELVSQRCPSTGRASLAFVSTQLTSLAQLLDDDTRFSDYITGGYELATWIKRTRKAMEGDKFRSTIFSSAQYADNWWHVRKYFQALRYRVAGQFPGGLSH